MRYFIGLLLCLPVLADEAKPLEGVVGDYKRGEALYSNHRGSLCLLCHKEGSGIAPSLNGVGARLSEAQIRFRIIDQRRVNPQTIMPAFYSLEGQMNVNDKFKGKTILGAQQIEDLVRFLGAR